MMESQDIFDSDTEEDSDSCSFDIDTEARDTIDLDIEEFESVMRYCQDESMARYYSMINGCRSEEIYLKETKRFSVIRYMTFTDSPFKKKFVFSSACWLGYVKLVEFFYNQNWGTPDRDAFFQACISPGKLAVVEFLIEKGFVVDKKAFYTACDSGNVHIVKYIVSRGYKIGASFKLKSVCHFSSAEVLEFLLDNGCKATEKDMINACHKTDIDIDMVRVLLEKGSIEVTEKIATAACEKRSLEMVELVLKGGYEPGKDCLDAALKNRNPGILVHLLQNYPRLSRYITDPFIEEHHIEMFFEYGCLETINEALEDLPDVEKERILELKPKRFSAKRARYE